MDDATKVLTALLVGAFSVAIFAVLVSQRSQTTNIIGQAGQALGYVISQAVSPVTQGSGSLSNSSYTTQSSGYWNPSAGNGSLLTWT